jgi:uncharacterized protein (TIGR02996 family)
MQMRSPPSQAHTNNKRTTAAEEEDFLSQLRQKPDDDDTRLVYADWLEEHSRNAESQFLRFQAKLRSMSVDDPKFEFMGVQFRNMASLLDPKWRAIVSYAPIEQCEQVRFDFPCPKQWTSLEPTNEGDDIRFCGSCKKNVYFSRNLDDAYEHARQGRCVAVDPVQIRVPGDLKNRLQLSLMMDGPGVPMAGAMMPPPPPPLIEPEPPADAPTKTSLFDRVRRFFGQ